MRLPLNIKITTHGGFPDLSLIQQSLEKEGYISTAGYQIIIRFMGSAGTADPMDFLTIVTVQDVKRLFKE